MKDGCEFEVNASEGRAQGMRRALYVRADVWGYAADIKVLLDTGAAVSIANPALWTGMTQQMLKNMRRKLAPTSVCVMTASGEVLEAWGEFDVTLHFKGYGRCKARVLWVNGGNHGMVIGMDAMEEQGTEIQATKKHRRFRFVSFNGKWMHAMGSPKSYAELGAYTVVQRDEPLSHAESGEPHLESAGHTDANTKSEDPHPESAGHTDADAESEALQPGSAGHTDANPNEDFAGWWNRHRKPRAETRRQRRSRAKTAQGKEAKSADPVEVLQAVAAGLMGPPQGKSGEEIETRVTLRVSRQMRGKGTQGQGQGRGRTANLPHVDGDHLYVPPRACKTCALKGERCPGELKWETTENKELHKAWDQRVRSAIKASPDGEYHGWREWPEDEEVNTEASAKALKIVARESESPGLVTQARQQDAKKMREEIEQRKDHPRVAAIEGVERTREVNQKVEVHASHGTTGEGEGNRRRGSDLDAGQQPSPDNAAGFKTPSPYNRNQRQSWNPPPAPPAAATRSRRRVGRDSNQGKQRSQPVAIRPRPTLGTSVLATTAQYLQDRRRSAQTRIDPALEKIDGLRTREEQEDKRGVYTGAGILMKMKRAPEREASNEDKTEEVLGRKRRKTVRWKETAARSLDLTETRHGEEQKTRHPKRAEQAVAQDTPQRRQERMEREIAAYYQRREEAQRAVTTQLKGREQEEVLVCDCTREQLQ